MAKYHTTSTVPRIPSFTSTADVPVWIQDVLRRHAAFVLDRQGRLVAVSDRAETLLHADLTPLLGRAAPPLAAPRDRDRLQTLMGAMLSGQAASLGVRAAHVTHQLPSGELLPLLLEYQPAFDPAGRLTLHLVLLHETRGPGETRSLSEPTLEKYAALLEASLGRLSAALDGPAPSVAEVAERQREMASLTQREREIFDRLLEGRAAKEIASQLHLSVHTVKSHSQSVFRKFGARSRAELLSRFVDSHAPQGTRGRKAS